MVRNVTLVVWAVLAVAFASSGCGREDRSAGSAEGAKIATLAPHIAEIAYSLGLTDNIVAVGRYCRRVEGLDAPAVSDAVSVNCEALAATGAKLVFHNSRDAFFLPLTRIDPEVRIVRLPNATLDELYAGIRTMGSLTGRAERADRLVGSIQGRLAAVAARAAEAAGRPRVLFLAGFDPPATVGAGWVTSQLIELAGGVNAAAESGIDGWTSLNLEAIAAMRPQIVICHVAPEPALRKRAAAFTAALAELMGKDAPVVHLCDQPGLLVPGPNIAETAELFYRLIHPNDAATPGEAPAEAPGEAPSEAPSGPQTGSSPAAGPEVAP